MVNSTKPLAGIALALALALAAGSAPALADLAPQTQNGITYVTGGVGQDESSAIQAMAKDYSLRVLCSAGGDYMAAVKVTIRDAAGKTLLSMPMNGPYLLAKLPPGRYTVAASAGRGDQNRSVEVPAKGLADVHFAWPARGGAGN